MLTEVLDTGRGDGAPCGGHSESWHRVAGCQRNPGLPARREGQGRTTSTDAPFCAPASLLYCVRRRYRSTTSAPFMSGSIASTVRAAAVASVSASGAQAWQSCARAEPTPGQLAPRRRPCADNGGGCCEQLGDHAHARSSSARALVASFVWLQTDDVTCRSESLQLLLAAVRAGRPTRESCRSAAWLMPRAPTHSRT